MSYANQEKSLEIKQVILKHLQTILEISSHELRDTTRKYYHSNQTIYEEHEDTRFSYCQAIENLAYVLMPYFDKKIKEIYKEKIKIFHSFDFEILEFPEIKKLFDKVKENNKDANLQQKFLTEMKIRYAKELFYELNLLLKRNNYLAKAVYGEDSSEEVVEEFGDD